MGRLNKTKIANKTKPNKNMGMGGKRKKKIRKKE